MRMTVNFLGDSIPINTTWDFSKNVSVNIPEIIRRPFLSNLGYTIIYSPETGEIKVIVLK